VIDYGTDYRDPDDTLGATWQAVDLAPYLAGDAVRPVPTVGMARLDGLRLMYAGKEHTVIGEMEAGKSWYAIASVAAEITTGHHVLYIHFEETDPTDTVERLQALDISDDVILARLRFVGPSEPVDPFVLATLLDPVPSLVVLDGVNEAMSLHGTGIRDEDGAALFRRRLVKPCTAVGAAVLGADHVVKDRERRDRGPLGSIHKGNGLNGSLILLENVEPFGRGQRGASHVFVTKDRPGHLRRHGRASKLPGKTYMGTLIVDDNRTKVPWTEVVLTEPPDQPDTEHAVTPEQADEAAVLDAVLDAVTKVLGQYADEDEGKPDEERRGEVSLRTVRAVVKGIRKTRSDDALERLILDGRLRERRGPNRSRLFRLPDSEPAP